MTRTLGKGIKGFNRPTEIQLRIQSVAHALPGADLPGVRVSNQHMVEVLEQARLRLNLEIPMPDADFAVERVGVVERSFLDRSFETEDLAWAACEKLRPQIDPERLRVIVVSSVTYNRSVPSLASILHDRLGLGPDVIAFDSALACHGFVGGLKIVEGLLERLPEGSQALLVASELMSRKVDALDRQTCVIFGDGAAATLLEKRREARATVGWSTQGSKGPMIVFADRTEIQRFWVEDGVLQIRPDPFDTHYLLMQGRQVFRDMVSTLPDRVRHEIQLAGYGLQDFDHFLFHQANLRIVDLVSERLGLEPERVVNNIERVGNTSSASIPILLSEMLLEGRLQAGQKVLTVGFGAGYSVAVGCLNF